VCLWCPRINVNADLRRSSQLLRRAVDKVSPDDGKHEARRAF
jgi:hypothetical protein